MNEKKEYEVYERVFSSHWLLTCYNGIGYVQDSKKIGSGDFISEIIYLMRNGTCEYIYNKNEFEKQRFSKQISC